VIVSTTKEKEGGWLREWVFVHCYYCDEIEKSLLNSEWMSDRMHETEVEEGLDAGRRVEELVLEVWAALTFVRVN
jgi:hypothetical protein